MSSNEMMLPSTCSQNNELQDKRKASESASKNLKSSTASLQQLLPAIQPSLQKKKKTRFAVLLARSVLLLKQKKNNKQKAKTKTKQKLYIDFCACDIL